MSKDVDALFIELTLERQTLTEAQVERLRRTAAKLRTMGVSRTLLQIARDEKALSSEEAALVERELRKRGALPRIGGYEVMAKLGDGAMGTVYKARQVSLDRVVAVKVLRRDTAHSAPYIRRFEREARLAAKLTHRNAVRVLDVGQDRGLHYIVMEFVDGPSVSKLLAKGPLEEHKALKITRDVAGALAQAHAMNIIHRDIKPSNILLTSEGTGKLSDLGIAKDVATTTTSLTDTNAITGTPAYMSPEQCAGLKDVDHRADIYCLGATLYHMACGKPPYDAPTPVVLVNMHLSTPFPEPKAENPSLSSGTAQLIKDMTAKDRAVRLQSSEAVVKRIDRILSMPAPVEERDRTMDLSPEFRAQAETIVEPVKSGETARQVLLRTRAVDRELVAVRELASVWQKMGESVETARKADRPLDVQEEDFAVLREFVVGRYEGVLSLLERPEHAARVINECRSGTSLAAFQAMGGQAYSAFRSDWLAGVETLAEFEVFLVEERREILRANWFRYYWAKYMETTAVKVALWLLCALIVGSALFVVARGWVSEPQTETAKPKPATARPGTPPPTVEKGPKTIASVPERSLPVSPAEREIREKNQAALEAKLASLNFPEPWAAEWKWLDMNARVVRAAKPGEHPGHEGVIVEEPLLLTRGSRLVRTVAVPAANPVLIAIVCGGVDCYLAAYVNGTRYWETVVDGQWHTYRLDFSRFAGKEVKIELVQTGGGPHSLWYGDGLWWDSVALVSERKEPADLIPLAEIPPRQTADWYGKWEVKDNLAAVQNQNVLPVAPILDGREFVFETHPLSSQKPCRISRTCTIPHDNPHLKLIVRGLSDFLLKVRVDAKVVYETAIGRTNWTTLRLDLSPWTGTTKRITLEQCAGGSSVWQFEHAFWADIQVASTKARPPDLIAVRGEGR